MGNNEIGEYVGVVIRFEGEEQPAGRLAPAVVARSPVNFMKRLWPKRMQQR